jgi:hypothetical protein
MRQWQLLTWEVKNSINYPSYTISSLTGQHHSAIDNVHSGGKPNITHITDWQQRWRSIPWHSQCHLNIKGSNPTRYTKSRKLSETKTCEAGLDVRGHRCEGAMCDSPSSPQTILVLPQSFSMDGNTSLFDTLTLVTWDVLPCNDRCVYVSTENVFHLLPICTSVSSASGCENDHVSLH